MPARVGTTGNVIALLDGDVAPVVTLLDVPDADSASVPVG